MIITACKDQFMCDYIVAYFFFYYKIHCSNLIIQFYCFAPIFIYSSSSRVVVKRPSQPANSTTRSRGAPISNELSIPYQFEGGDVDIDFGMFTFYL